MTPRKPKLTREAFHESLKPPNNCRVKAFMETMDAQSRAVLEEAMAMDKREYSSPQILTLLTENGYRDHDLLPGVDAITNHRSGRNSCKCRG